MPGWCVTAETNAGLTVTGVGRAAGPPDVFVLAVGAEATSERAGAALSLAADALQRIRSAALDHGVPAEALSTQQLVLRQGYDHQGQPRGLTCELGLRLRSGDIAGAGALVVACIEAGGDQARLIGAGFEHSDPAGLLIAARRSAFEDALARASQLAALAGRDLGSVQRIVETEPTWVPLQRGQAVSVLAADLPIDPGTLDTTVSVTVTWGWA